MATINYKKMNFQTQMQTQKNHEEKFTINKILKDKIKKQIKKKDKKIVIKRIMIKFNIKKMKPSIKE